MKPMVDKPLVRQNPLFSTSAVSNLTPKPKHLFSYNFAMSTLHNCLIGSKSKLYMHSEHHEHCVEAPVLYYLYPLLTKLMQYKYTHSIWKGRTRMRGARRSYRPQALHIHITQEVRVTVRPIQYRYLGSSNDAAHSSQC